MNEECKQALAEFAGLLRQCERINAPAKGDTFDYNGLRYTLTGEEATSDHGEPNA